MSEDTVTVDGQEYVFPPDEVVKPEKQETQEENNSSSKLLYDGSNGGVQ